MLSVIIVNWKVRELLRKCLESVQRETKGVEYEVIVVDNDSRDGSIEMVVKEFPWVRLIASNRNMGFARANNEAIRQASGDLVMLLNPDTELRQDVFGKMTGLMNREPHIAILGPKLLDADGSLQPSVRRFPTLASQLVLKLHHLFPRVFPLRRSLARDFDYDRMQPCDQVMGAAMMIRRSVLEEIGLLDEGYFIWFEEVDLCKRAVDAGYQVWYWPGAEVVHHGGESFGQLFGPRRQRLYNAAARRYFRKHSGLAAYLLLLVVHPFSMAASWTYYVCRSAFIRAARGKDV